MRALPGRDFIGRLSSLLVPGGLVVHVSPFSWLPQYTKQELWLGGRVKADGSPDPSLPGLMRAMQAQGFELLHTEDCPFLIREHARKFQGLPGQPGLCAAWGM